MKHDNHHDNKQAQARERMAQVGRDAQRLGEMLIKKAEEARKANDN